MTTSTGRPTTPVTWESTVSSRLNSLLDAELIASGKSCLVKIYPPGSTDGLIALGDGPLLVGRDAKCDLVLADDSLSRRHAKIEKRDGRFYVTDLDSTNGTYVNNERTAEAVLQAGDHIRLGNQIFKFLSADNVEAQYHEAVFQMMTTDGLTGAYNKRYLVDVLARELLSSQRHARSLSLMMIDIDRFKKINDRYGHLAGDEVLQQLCDRARRVLRRQEVLARYGGEEFAVVMTDTPLAEAAQVAERLRAAVAGEPFATAEAAIEVTVSIGIADTRGEDHLSPIHLIQQADQKLYEAKRSGRNRVRV